MATFTKVPLSGSTQGKAILVAATASPGTTIHTTGTSATTIDEVWLYAYNSSTSATVMVTVQYGGTTSPDNDIKVSIPPQSGEMLVVPGFMLMGNGSAGLSVLAWAGTTNVITITGYVNRIA